ncbi:uncharacterized protein LOC133727466 [Rosa rugosa]|uniref:uncharacterized protein LOC133727466 n=1 Tax=Rosa rugosa TaxID=74645 RepID=UPI002B405F89|nr:uncharacterized protein LOC133727466 [Rosa rugosa]XP_062011027.1 uncharacterized protein LOC133727466 [Rosa rugosa]XP_062011028.1 uncharacterized protein LOC133727466 [Rosa rugosa]
MFLIHSLRKAGVNLHKNILPPHENSWESLIDLHGIIARVNLLLQMEANHEVPSSPVLSCPFSLNHGEERAARRKEFFERLEEKKSGEAESKQLQMRDLTGCLKEIHHFQITSLMKQPNLLQKDTPLN